MALLSDIKGQDNAVRYLSNNLRSGRIANGYLFIGPEGVGKALAAKAFLMALMCPEKGEGSACGQCPVCKRINEQSHPDVLWIRPENSRKIKIEEIRKAKDMLSLKPYESSISACVIEEAHMMTMEASNALLKVLEEPPGQALLILISNKREWLLPTVLSRCVEVRFHYLPVDETKDIMMRHSAVDKETAYFLAYFSGGSPGRALEMMDEDILARKKGITGVMESIINKKSTYCVNWDKEARPELLEDLELLVMLFRDIAVGNEGLEEMVMDKGMIQTGMYDFFRDYSVDKVYEILERLIELKRALEGYANPKLVAQVLPRELIR